MNRLWRRLGAGLLAAALFFCAAPAARAEQTPDFEGKTLEQIVDGFRAENGLDKSNFSLCYYDTVTGESYRYNETKMMVAASTFKLPLNLYYYELQADGKISGSDRIPDSGTTLDECHRRSLVNSDNEVSIAMLYNLGNFSTYKQLMRKYFTMTDGEIDPSYYGDNLYCTRMMIDCLQYLYERQDQFPEMIGYLKQAEPDAYFKRYVTDCEIAHKYGSFEGAENDTGIFYTKEPFLLAVYTQGVVGEEICAEAGRLLYEYNTWQYEKTETARLEKAAQAGEEKRLAAAEAQAEALKAAQQSAAEAAQKRPAAPVTSAAAGAATSAPAETSGKKNVRLWLYVVIALAAAGAALVAASVGAAISGKKKSRKK